MNRISKSAVINFSVLVEMSNPNGDVDTGEPRTRPDGKGWITDKCIKRHIRDMIDGEDNPFVDEISKKIGISKDELNIFESAKRGFYDAKDEVDAKNKATYIINNNFNKACSRYWDIRMFGVMPLQSIKGENKSPNNIDIDSINGKKSGRTSTIRGCSQVTNLVSVSPVDIITATGSKKFPLEDQKLIDHQCTLTPGSIKIVSHGLYYGSIFINANESKNVGANDNDIEVLKLSIPMLFSRRSACRAGVYVVQAVIGYHNSVMQSFREDVFNEACRPKVKKLEEDGSLTFSPTSVDDYNIPSLPEIEQKMHGTKINIIDLLRG